MRSHLSSPSTPASVIFAAGLLLSLAASPVAAADISAQSKITAVTVFPDRAQVTRLVEIPLPSGATTVLLSNLPANLLGDSLRVEGEGNARILLGAVEARQVFSSGEVRAEERRLKSEIQALEDRQRAAKDAIEALRFKQSVIYNIGTEFPKTKDEDGKSTLPSPDTWVQAWNALGQGTAEVLAEIHKAELESRELQRQIDQKRNELSQIATGQKASMEARISVEASAPTTAKLRLIYQVPGASWRPLYDARLDAKTEKISLSQIGEVRQRTGEDWDGVELTLSTSRPATGAQVPQLASWFIDVLELKARREREKMARSEAQELDLLEDRLTLGGPATAPEPAQSAAPMEAAIAASEFAAEYRITGRVIVPADNSAKKFPIKKRDINASLTVLAVPKVLPQAFLMAEIAYQGEEPLLPGPVSVFRDGAFIGNSTLSLLRPGEDFQLSFGVDDRVRIGYQLVDGQRSSEGLINRDRRIERLYHIEVINLHKRPIRIAVQDQIPVAQDERIEVEFLRSSTKPTETDIEERKGVLQWAYDYEADETREIKFGYSVQFPEDANVAGF